MRGNLEFPDAIGLASNDDMVYKDNACMRSYNVHCSPQYGALYKHDHEAPPIDVHEAANFEIAFFLL